MSKLAKKSELVANACREKIGQLEADAPQRDADVVEAKRAMAEAESQLEEIESTLKGKTEALRKELKEASKELKPLGKICDASKAEVEECRSEIDLVKDRSITARKKYEKLQRELQEASECVEGHGAAVKQLEDQITMKQERVVAAKEELASVQSGEAQSQLDIESIRNKREELQSELGNAQATTGASRATGMLAALQSKEAGVGSDLLGRLGDLGGIDAKYDVAVSTAAGALNHLVTRTVDGAQRCIDYLRENDLGRATFIVLEKIQYLENAMNGFKKEKAERLFDLIRPRDDEVRVAFYYACRDTLVAKSLDHASKIAYDGNKCVFRVVALTGELIELSGTMSGGGGRPRRGYMGEEATAFSAQSDEETKQAQMEVARIESALSAVEEDHRIACKQRDVLVRRKKELTKEIREVETWLKKATTKLSKMALNVKASQDILPDLTRNVEEVRPTIKPTEEEKLRVHELTEMLEEKETLYKAAHSNTAGLERRVGELQSSIMNVGGNDLKRAKKVFKNFANQLKEAEANVARSAVDIKALQKKIDTAEKEKVKAEKEHKSCVQTMTKTIEALKELDGHATECVETFNAIQTSEQEAKAAVVEKEKEYVVAAKELKKKSTKVEELDDAMKELDEKHERLQHELSVWEEKITKLMTTFNNDEDLTSNLDEEGEDGGEVAEEAEEGEDESKENSSSSSRQFLLQTPTVKEIDEANIEELETAINTLESKITQLRDEIDMSALAAYNAAHKDWRTRAKEFDAATIARDAARTVYEALRKERLDTFMKGFSIITLKLKEMYQMITLGGDAELELVDTLDPFAEGIVFSVRPKGKSWKNIANLSGGEKTLSSLALVFALHHYKPTPLYVMDEIDAALDFRNVSIVANYIKERTKNAQFIIISLRNNMFELADRLVGIYKTNNSTKSVAINPQMIAMEAEKNLPATKTMTKSTDQAAPLSVRNK